MRHLTNTVLSNIKWSVPRRSSTKPASNGVDLAVAHQVVFYREAPGVIIAAFPYIPGKEVTCYQPGLWLTAEPGYVNSLTKVPERYYRGLYNELINLGYKLIPL